MAKVTKELAKQVSDETKGGPASLIEDAVSVCDYVSRRHGIELTVSQGDKLLNLIDEVRANDLSDEEHAALADYAREHGRTWKSDLRDDWLNSRLSGTIHKLRNVSYFGPTGLNLYKLPKATASA